MWFSKQLHIVLSYINTDNYIWQGMIIFWGERGKKGSDDIFWDIGFHSENSFIIVITLCRIHYITHKLIRNHSLQTWSPWWGRSNCTLLCWVPTSRWEPQPAAHKWDPGTPHPGRWMCSGNDQVGWHLPYLLIPDFVYRRACLLNVLLSLGNGLFLMLIECFMRHFLFYILFE